MSDTESRQEIERLQSRIASLEQLLAVHERTAVEQAEQLEQTIRGRVEQEAIAARQQLLDIIDFLPDATFVIDQDKKVIAWNRAAEEMTGVRKEDILGQGDYAYAVPFYGDRRPITIDLLDVQDSESRIEYEYVHKQGNTLFAEVFVPTVFQGRGADLWVTASPLLDSQGNRVGAIESIRDITERKRAEATMAQEKIFSDTVINSLPGIFYLFDAQGRLVRWNKNYEEVLGYSSEEIAQRNALDGIAEEDRERVAGVIQQAFVLGQANVEAQVQTRQGLRIPYYFTGSRISIANELYVAGTGIDLSERRRLEDQIQESLARRGAQVQTSTEVAQEIAAVQNLDELYRRVVTLVKERFGYYHAQIFRYDAAQDAVALVTGYGKVGEKMLAAGHRLAAGRGVVGTAADTGQPVLATDVAQDKDWRPNPNLPETKGELAVPIKLRDEVLGILDVQSDRVGALTAEDQLLLEGLCGQIAVAMDATRLRQEIETELRIRDRALASSINAVMINSLDGKAIYVNDAFLKLFGYTREQALALTAADTAGTHEEVETVLSAYQSQGFFVGESLSKRKDGSVFPVSMSSSPIINAEGQPIAMQANFVDITERRQAEAQIARTLRETQVRYQISQALAGAQTEEDVLEVLGQHAGFYPQACVLIYMLDTQGGELTVVLRSAHLFESGVLLAIPIGARFPMSAFAALRFLSADRPFVSDDAFSDERVDPASLALIRRAGATSFAAVPLAVGTEWVGLIVAMAKPAGYFDEAKQYLYQTLAEQGVVALQTARLRDQIRESLARRGAQVQTSTEVAQEIAAVQNLDELYRRVVTLVKERFGYYHAQIFRYDAAQDAVALVTGYGEAGEKMLAAGHRLAAGRGVVGTAADTGQPVLATDVAQDKDWRPNPNLPETKGELAVPIKLRDEVLGILDVQSDRVGALTAEDQLLLEGLCGQIAVAMDATRLRQEIETELRIKDRALASSVDAVMINALDGRALYVNDAFLKAFGYTTEEALRLAPTDVIGDPRQFTDHIAVALQTQGYYVGENVAKRKDGSLFPIQVSSSLITDASGQPIAMQGAFVDITERKQAEENFRKLADLNQTILDAVNVGITYVADRRTQWVNRAFLDMFGTDQEEIVHAGTSIFYANEDDFEKIGTEGYPAILRGKVYASEILMKRKKGETFWVSLSGKAINPDDPNQGSIWMLQDVNERKRAQAQVERTLRETQMRYQVSQALSVAQTEDDVLDVLEQHAGLYPEAMVLLYTFDRQGEEVVTILRRVNAFESGITTTMPVGTRFPASRFPILNLLSPDKSFISNDFLADERVDSTTRQAAQRVGAASQAVFPLAAGSDWMGFINVTSGSAGYFDETKLYLYQALAELGAAALQTARLRDQIRESLARRGAQVQTSTEVAQEIAAVQNLDELYRRVVTLVKERFGYYHAQIFRYDAAQDAVALVTGYGEAGEKMLAAGHRLAAGRGVVGTAADTGQSVLATDVAQDKDWRPNPNLPETKGELAVPIKLRDEVLGILDVQSDRAGALTAEDQLLLEGLCGQIAVAMESTRLLEQADIFRRFADASGQGLWMADMERSVVYMNPALLRMLGLGSAEEVLGKSLLPYYSPEVRQQMEGEVIQAVMREGQWTGELALRSVTGDLMSTIQTFFFIRDRDGNPAYLANVATDITERKLAEVALRETEERFRVISETVPVPILISSMADGKVLYGNENLGQTFGIPIQDLIGRPTPDFYFDPADRQPLTEQLRQHGMLHDYELHVKKFDGTPFWVLVSMRLMTFAGQPALLAAFYDVTERRQAEAQMQETLRELERLNRAATHEGWQAFLQTGQLAPAYQYDRTDVRPAQDLQMPQIEQAIRQNRPVPSSEESAAAVVPLSVRGAVVGVLGVYDDPQRPLSPDELALLQEIAEQGALALENARLYQDTQRSAEQERLVGEITARMRASLDVETVLKTAAEQIRQSLGAQKVVVQLAPEEAARQETP